MLLIQSNTLLFFPYFYSLWKHTALKPCQGPHGICSLGSNFLKALCTHGFPQALFTCWWSPVNNLPVLADSEPHTERGKRGSLLPRPLHSSRLWACYVRAAAAAERLRGTSSSMIEIEKKKTSFIPLASLETSHAYKVDLQWDENNSWQLITKNGKLQYNTAQRVCTFSTHTVQEQDEEWTGVTRESRD